LVLRVGLKGLIMSKYLDVHGDFYEDDELDHPSHLEALEEFCGPLVIIKTDDRELWVKCAIASLEGGATGTQAALNATVTANKFTEIFGNGA